MGAPRRPGVPGLAPAPATGRIDVLFEEGGELVVLDWKSDSVGPKGVAIAAETHRPQAEAYARSLTAATSKPVQEVVFFFPRAGASSAVRTSTVTQPKPSTAVDEP